MYFQHASEVWGDYPELVAGAVSVTGVTADVTAEARIARLTAAAETRLASGPEGELPEIQAWRRAFARMGLKPTQYRCAAESLLRRFRKERALPRIHPLVDLCNAGSLAYAIPVAVFDLGKVSGDLTVRYAGGAERYLSFSGETEHPAPDEVIFADAAGNAHARRWTHRQSALSAVGDATRTVLIVAEALHSSAAADVAALTATIGQALQEVWSLAPSTAILTRSAPRFETAKSSVPLRRSSDTV